MSTKTKKCLRFENDNNSNYIDVKKPISPSLDNTNDDISEKHTNAFEKLLNGEKNDLLNL